ncbi:MAG: preprotein translocase subunit SecA, partial [Patescibacteria group bacterium]
MSLLTKIFGDANKRILSSYTGRVEEISLQEKKIQSLSDQELRDAFLALKKELPEDLQLFPILPRAFAYIREAGRRTLSMRHFDVQLIGAMVLHDGKIAEMRTGEGKTLVATLPVAANALVGKGVHVVTVNDYLARRDAVWMGPLYNALGLSIGIIQHEAAFLYDPTYTQAG